MTRRYLVVIVLFLAVKLSAQDNSARLVTIIGSHIEFNFNTLDDYNNGITMNNATTLGVLMEDIASANTVVGWHLDVQAFNGAGNIQGTVPANFLNLNTIQIEATDANGNLVGATFDGPQDLAIPPGNRIMSTAVPLHTPANPNTHQINLSYTCGTLPTNNLLGQTADLYRVEIEVILIPDF